MFKNREGQEIDVIEWGRLKEDPNYTVVAEDRVLCPSGRVAHLRTMWFGFIEPTICSTCLRNFGSGLLDEGIQTVAVYDTEQDARAGHERLKQLLLKGDQLSAVH